MAAPTLADARRAAQRIAARHCVGSVLLYGSVARGEAADGSDIDLVAVFDDLGDYRGRHGLQKSVAAAAREAVNCEVDVRVTDRPEWRHRSQAVANCFEHHIIGEAVPLVDVPAGTVDWGKEIGMPDSEQTEADRHVNGMGDDLDSIKSRYLPNDDEIASELAAGSDTGDLDARRRRRHKSLCAHGAMCIEHGLKALVAMGGEWPRRTHNPEALIAQIAPQHRAPADAVPGNLLAAAVDWRQAGTYEAVLESMGLTDEDLCAMAEDYIDAAVSLAAAVIAEYERTFSERSRAAAMLAQDCQSVHRLRATARLWDGTELTSPANFPDRSTAQE